MTETKDGPELQRLLDYVARAALAYCRAKISALSVVDRYGKVLQSVQCAGGAKLDPDRLEDVFRQARKSEEPVERSRGDRHIAGLPFRIRSTFHGLLYLEGGCRFEPEQIEMARHLIDFASLSIENSFLRSRMLTDQLTGLFNSNYVKTTLERELRMARGLDKKLALLLIDIDNFSQVNNQHGTATGDAVLAATGERLAEELKSFLGVTAHRVNVWLEGHVGRYGGDEFAFVIFDSGQKMAEEVAQKILDAFRRRPLPLPNSETSIPITVSVGGAIFPDDAGNAEKLFVKAYHALYTAKVNGKNQFWLCSQAPDHPEASAASPGLSPRGQTALTVVMKTITEDLPLDQILARTLSQVMKETRADRGRLVLLDEAGAVTSSAQAGGDPDPAPPSSSRALTGSLMRVPLDGVGRVAGIIELHSAAGGFGEEDFSLMKAMGSRAGVGLGRTRRLQMATQQLKKLEETLRRGLRELSERYTFQNIVGRSKPMHDVFALMEKVCSVDYPVIIEGETGTGKELVAKSIHFNSRRKDRPFIPINCAAISETILESELFGHVKGAFTGADEYKAGLFELASGGSLFLDEIEEMSQTLQRKLLRVLEDRNVRPVGAKDVISVDVRVIASTNRPVKDLLAKNQLREDLYYRLATFVIHLPSLRDRVEDIPLLCEHLLAEISRELNGPKKTLDPDAMGVLMRHPWPGNIRELRNELRKAYVLSPSERISPTHFSAHVTPSELTPAYEGDYAKAIQQFERSMILQALEHHKWNLTHAAQALGLARNTLKAKLRQYDIKPHE